MEMVVVVHPTLDEYAQRVSDLAQKYNCDDWMTIPPDKMDGDDRHELSFIRMAVGDMLIHQYFSASGPPQESLFADAPCEPGYIPGSHFLWGGDVWTLSNTPTSSRRY